MARMTKLPLLALGCLAVTAIAYWQSASDAAPAAPPAVLDLQPAAVAATSTEGTAATPAKIEAAPARVKDTATTSTRKAPAPVKRLDRPAAVTVERRETPEPPSVPDVKVPPARAMTYEQRVASAAAIAGEDSDRAMLELRRVTADQPSRPEAYEAMAGISLRKQDYIQAREQFGLALDRGGKATFSIIHDHSRGNFDLKDPKATCVGELTIFSDAVRFEGPGDGDHFSANWADVRDTGSNKFFGSGIGGFHLTTTASGKYKNVNLAPESKDKAEGKLILELLSAYARPSDRTK
jgi:hypothetical protein